MKAIAGGGGKGGGEPAMCSGSELRLLRGTILNRTYGPHKNRYISLLLPTIFGPVCYGPPQEEGERKRRAGNDRWEGETETKTKRNGTLLTAHVFYCLACYPGNPCAAATRSPVMQQRGHRVANSSHGLQAKKGPLRATTSRALFYSAGAGMGETSRGQAASQSVVMYPPQ